MNQIICASVSHTQYWYEVGMLKIPACYSARIAFMKYARTIVLEFHECSTRITSFYMYTPCTYDTPPPFASPRINFIPALLWPYKIYHQPPSSCQSRVHRVNGMHLRTDGVHRQEFVGSGPVVLKVVRVTGMLHIIRETRWVIICALLLTSPTMCWYCT